MLEIEAEGLIRFLIQLSAAAAGASSLWGFVLVLRKQKEMVRLLFPFFAFSLVVFLVSWFWAANFFFAPESFGHEGVALEPAYEYVRRGFEFNFPFVAVLAVLSFIGIFIFRFRKEFFEKSAGFFFLAQFILLSVIIAFGVFTGAFGREQLFFFFHGWHSILTLGTVLTVDFLYIATKNRGELKRIIYPFFPVMSAAIWLGLGLDFLSVGLIFKEAFHLTTQFFFNQTVIAAIILNGAFLSGRINEKLISFIYPSRVLNPDKKTEIFFSLAGAVSIVSWTTITFLDFFEFGLSYIGFWLVYLSIIALAFLIQYPLRKIEDKIFQG